MPVTQTERVYIYMKEFGSITSIEAMNRLGVMRLASRIADLRKQGIAIEKEMAKGKNRYGESTTFARYKLKEKEN